MSRRRRPKRARSSTVAPPGGVTVRENLPYPVVHYPPSTGAFFGFSVDESAAPVLCACARPAVEHAVRLGALEAEAQGYDPGEGGVLDPLLLPARILEQTRGDGGDPLSAIQFERGLCHRCTLAAPTLRYCHEMEGGRFVQYYGWYVGQAYLRFGIQPSSLRCLPEVCPDELVPYVSAVGHTAQALREASDLLASSEGNGDSRARLAQAQHQYATRRYRRACMSLDKQIENLVRAEFGFGKVSEVWISEAMLHRIVCQIYPDEQVLRGHHPEWLGGLELDVYLPELGLAFEYQGQQHFHPIRAWGGEEAQQKVRERDACKARTCAERGVTLIAIDYTEPLTETYVRGVLSEQGVGAAVARPRQVGGSG